MVRLTDSQKEGLSKHMLKKFEEHPPATKTHIRLMVENVKKGMRFNKAHDEAIKVEKPKTYVPKGLSKKDEKKQIESITKGTDRPKLKSFKSKRSGYVERFEEKYGYKITNKGLINSNILKAKGQEEILDKGMAAYYTSGSRPNQTPHSWAYGRLASVILNGPARKIDKKIWDKYKVKK